MTKLEELLNTNKQLRSLEAAVARRILLQKVLVDIELGRTLPLAAEAEVIVKADQRIETAWLELKLSL